MKNLATDFADYADEEEHAADGAAEDDPSDSCSNISF